jgi:hypothetical protein
MALTYEQFVELSGCEIVCGNLIVGQMAQRKVVGTNLDGTFVLNDDGIALAAELEAGTASAEKAPRRKKADAASATEGEQATA